MPDAVSPDVVPEPSTTLVSALETAAELTVFVPEEALPPQALIETH